MVPLSVIHKSLVQFSGLLFVPASVMRPELSGELGERQNCSLQDPRPADHHVGPTVCMSCSHCEVVVHPCVLQLVPQNSGLYGAEGTQETNALGLGSLWYC